MAPISLSAVRKIYGNSVEAVKGVSLDIADGELIVLVGPSGCGKSTLLRMVAGLETVTEGDIAIDGDRVNDREPAERDIAMVFQNYALYPHMSVFDNLAYGLKNRKVAKTEIAERVAETARILEIDHLLDRKPRQLSGGQRQRVAMGRAIARKPKAFLFDEPLSNLDAKLRVQMRVEIRKLQRALKTTSIYVTHDQLEAMTLADRLVVMNQGRIEQVGAPLDVYARPETVFVAGFIGSPGMNLVPASALPDIPSDGAQADGTIGFRPEDVCLPEPGHQKSNGGGVDQSGRQGADRGAALVCQVSAVERVGAEAFVHARIDGADTLLTARLPGDIAIDFDDRLDLWLPLTAIHRFDGETGRRLS